jgi:chorismate synthase
MLEKLRYLTSGESHGQALVCIIDGVPSNLSLSAKDIDRELARRQKGYGRGGRMKIESDRVKILSGIRWGKTIGSPIALLIENKDWSNWKEIMSPDTLEKTHRVAHLQKGKPVTRPRPGHADLSGALKYGQRDLRNVLERSSARETASRVAAGAIAKKFLSEFNITVISYVTEIGGVGLQNTELEIQDTDTKKILSIFKKAETSPVRCPDKKGEAKIIRKINGAIKRGTTLGGIFEVVVIGVPAGLGSYSQWDRRLNAKLAYSIMGIQAIKGVEIGLGFETARKYGSEVLDEIYYRRGTASRALIETGKMETAGGFYRKTNNAGGIEGGVSNGMSVIVRAAMKPIPTQRNPLSSVDIATKKSFKAAYERSDACAVPAASVIGEAAAAIVITDCFLEKFGGDSMEEIKRNYKGYLKQLEKF